MPAKSMLELFSLKCMQRCREKISEEQRKKNFNSFYEHGNKTRQWDCIARYVESRATVMWREHSKRMVTKNDCKSFVQQTNWEKNTQNQKVGWATVKEVRVKAGRPNIIRYKTNDLDSDYKEVEIYSLLPPNLSTRKRKIKPFVFCDDFNQAYDGKLPIKTEKFNDLQALCKARVIAKNYHKFYDRLG
jgi:hypothetical protein